MILVNSSTIFGDVFGSKTSLANLSSKIELIIAETLDG